MTDGEENASLEYSGRQIRDLIRKLKDNHWTFTYIGTDHDVEKSARDLAIDNTLHFSKDEDGLKTMFAKENASRKAYSNRIEKTRYERRVL